MAALGSLWWNDPTAPEEKAPENDLRDLYVFGYACKLFRDDEKAKSIDDGKHLIPWMGDERLMIDRYDGRGHLFDLSKYDADLQKGRTVELSEEEAAVEAACDEERYLELHTDVQEKAMYEEEEWKRYYESLSHEGGYNAVGFSYEQHGATDTQQAGEAPVEEDDSFIPPEQLHIPDGMLLPETQKEHARMEKTATFIAQHGTQMEIMIKTKQSRNPQFAFMNFEHPLNQYYKHLVQMIKDGKYRPAHDQETKSEPDDHGLLYTKTYTPPKPIVMPKISIHDTPYGQLVTSFKKYSKTEVKKETGELAPPPLPPFMARPDYGSSTPLNSLPSSASQTQTQDEGEGGGGGEETRQPPPPGTEVMGPLPRAHSAGDLEGYGSRIVPPPPDIQPIIDRMAMYVAKNGLEFEIVVKSKKDPRFAFLEPGHMHFKYYNFKKQMYLQGNEGKKKKQDEEKRSEEKKQLQEDTAAAQANRSISFSIKGRNKEPESVNTLKRPLFDYDSSDGEAEGEAGKEKGSNSPCSLPEEIQTQTVNAPVAVVASSVSAGTVTLPGSDTKSGVATEDLERKQAEERLKDKLAVAARDKLATATREKQLQAERKRKASMFIKLLKIVKDSPMPEDGAASEGDVKHSPAASGDASPVVYEYNNRSGTPQRLDAELKEKGRKGSRSPSHSRKKRRKKSPTPPSAYANPQRSPVRYSPARRRSRSPWRGPIGSRRMSPIRQWQRRSPSPLRRASDRSPPRRQSRSPQRKKKSSKRSRSRSESPSVSKHKKKHKRSRSKTPKKKKKDKERSRSRDKDQITTKDKEQSGSRDKDKSRSKDKDRSGSRDRSADKEKHKDKHKNKDKKKDRDRSKEKKDKEREKDKESSKDSNRKKDKDTSKSGRHKDKNKESAQETAASDDRSAKSGDTTSEDVSPGKSVSNSLSISTSDNKVAYPVHEISSASSDSSSDSGDEACEIKDGAATSRTESQESCMPQSRGRSPVTNGNKQLVSDSVGEDAVNV
ncbi:hypothetical protein BaRGS_00038474 [Batillaria attramentaria]|uniref:SURP motif domain-containing protein n=1 Tax=Batillaria attramentaria TaxID=370345 RepID=A0ABD0J5K0_9CAEN